MEARRASTYRRQLRLKFFPLCHVTLHRGGDRAANRRRKALMKNLNTPWLENPAAGWFLGISVCLRPLFMMAAMWIFAGLSAARERERVALAPAHSSAQCGHSCRYPGTIPGRPACAVFHRWLSPPTPSAADAAAKRGTSYARGRPRASLPSGR
jgi:hypothetical protein